MTFWPWLTGCDTGNRNDTIGAYRSQLPETLRVATMYGPLSFFFFRDDTMGYDFSLAKDFAAAKGMILDITVATGLDSAIALLDSGRVDLIAYGVPVTAEYVRKVQHCGPEIWTSQVLVQRVDKEHRPISDVTQLVGRTVAVPRNSKYQFRLDNLNDEIGGGIDIRLLDADSLTDEDIIEKVSMGEIPMGVVNSDIASLNRTYYRNIDVSLEISFAQKSAWVVNRNDTLLADSITAWFDSEGTRRENETLLKRYFELSKLGPAYNLHAALSKGRISDYDAIFKRQAARIGWDWRLLAAMGYIESQFNNDLVSWAGARGIMQVMPSTAAAYGIEPSALPDPETCIRLAADVLQKTENIIARYINNVDERRKFVVAAYNSGAAHIIDAIALAKKYGHNPEIWSANVESALLMKSDPAYYNDPEVKYGYFRGRQTTRYVNDVFDLYERIKRRGVK